MVTSDSETQLAKTQSPIVRTESGITTFAKLTQPKKARAGIDVTEEQMVTSSVSEHRDRTSSAVGTVPDDDHTAVPISSDHSRAWPKLPKHGWAWSVRFSVAAHNELRHTSARVAAQGQATGAIGANADRGRERVGTTAQKSR